MSFVKVRSSEKLTQLVQQTKTITIPSFERNAEQAQSHYVILMAIPIMTTIPASQVGYLVVIVENGGFGSLKTPFESSQDVFVQPSLVKTRVVTRTES